MDLKKMRRIPPTATAMEIVARGICCFSVLIFIGYIMIWIMKPTTFFSHWFIDIHTKADPIHLGNQGVNLLIHTFPVLLIAILGCLYLHLERKLSEQNSKSKVGSSKWAFWKRPVLINGPLGIITLTELFFLGMFVSLLIWTFCSYLHSMFHNITQQAAKMRVHVWEAKLEISALTLGLVGNVCLAFMFFPVSRGSSILHFIGLTSEAGIKYHIWLGHTALVLFTAHGLCYIIYWINTDKISEMLEWSKTGISNVAGEISLLFGLILWATTSSRIRRKAFELFFYTHYLYIVFVVFFVLHVGINYSCIMLPGFYLFLIDRYLRFLQSEQRIRLVSARVLPCEVVELNFSKNPGLWYAPASVIFINIPSISKLQWHPFTISSCSETDPDKLSVIIKSEGSWSSALYQKLSSSSPIDHLDISVEGPHGPPSTFYSRHELLVLVCGGSGITPCISIIRELLFKANNGGSKTPRVLLVAAFKRSLDITMLDLLLPDSATNFNPSRLQLQIEAYVTREKQPANNDKKLLQTICFKPDASDVPVSAVLGQNSWLYLGMIISSSFLLFLLLIGILTRCYIYPIDHDSNKIYPRKQNKGLKKEKNMNNPTPVTSPGSVSHNSDRELESLPFQSFIQATKVHYGGRPNLKEILSDCDGSSIGVLVSGPREMRREVATICSSGLKDNLHFESISFSW
ncbi:hypothetical protein L6164_008380 [Bauhinia variegata]|uniref:Uncharacterized protein n=1 Tax=Bauhinia variegata TaxID=167791 RepID=A0ACB9PGB1_BAUVA|nr:hypothetical protein L6164_008380 [Bauhinia variegata]